MSGFIYNYNDTTKNNDNYQMRQKVDITDKFANLQTYDDVNGTYTGTGYGVVNTFNFSSNNKIPQFIFIQDTYSGSNNWAYLLPKERYGIVNIPGKDSIQVKLFDDGSPASSFKVNESLYKVEINFLNSSVLDGSCHVNILDHIYRYYAKF